MKPSRVLVCLTIGLWLLPAQPSLADPALGRSNDGYGAREDYGRERGGAQRRPLGTLPDDRGPYDRRHGDDGRDRRYDGGRWGDRDDRSRYREERYGHDARRAAEAVRRDERGRVLSSQPDDDRGYRVRVLTPDGYVRERYVDPRDDDREWRPDGRR